MRLLMVTILVVLAFGARGTDINELMRDMGDTMLRMLPALHQESPDRKVLMENLVRLDYLFDKAEPHLTARQVNSRVTYNLIRRRLDESIALGGHRNLVSLRSSISETFELCASCHSQDGVAVAAFGVSKLRELDEFEAAEFSFLTRDYGAALTSIGNYLEGETREPQRDQLAVERILAIGAEFYADPVFTANKLTEVLPVLTGRTRDRVRDWISVFERIADDDSGLFSPFVPRDIPAMDRFLSGEWSTIETTLGVHEREAYWVAIRGALSRTLTRFPDHKDVPKVLYWLAVSDRALFYRYYNALSTAYLESCIEDYRKHPYAERCLEEYEFLVLINFSGSGGTQVPFEVQERLNELRRRVR